MNWARYITGWALAEISGDRPERVLQALAERNVVFWQATPPEELELTVRVPDRWAERAVRLAASLGCEGEILARRGLPALFRQLRRRTMLWVWAAAVAAVLFVGSAYIWQIGIEGNETIPDRVILSALRQCGVDIGAFWPAMSQDQVRNSVILQVPGIRWMTVTIRGGHARVIVRESRIPPWPVQEREYVHITAKKAGLVEAVSAQRGTALTERGRMVLPGEVLIGGYATGRGGVQGPVRAMGGVTARTWYELTCRTPDTVQEKAYTGRQRSQWTLIVGKIRINFFKGSSICPAGCDKIIESYPLAVGELFTLPFTLERAVYREYDAVSVPADRGQEMRSVLTDYLAGQIGPDGETLSAWITASSSGGAQDVTLRAECREQIGGETPLTEEDLAWIREKIPQTEENGP